MSNSLELESVELRRSGHLLLSGLDLEVGPGELALVTGPNGSGKTTLLRAIAGLAPPSAGVVRLNGREIAVLEPEERASLLYYGHLDGLKKDLSIEENLLFIRNLYNSNESISSLISELGLGPAKHRAVRHLSAGQKRRCALATLRLSPATLWLLDEPLTNLDAAGRQLVTGWLDAHLARSGIAVVATHRADDLARSGSLLVEL